MFRVALSIFSVACWALLGWLAGHQSEHPALWGRYSAGYALFLVPFLALALGSLALHFGRAYRWLFARRQGITLSLVSLLVALGLSEWLLRLTDPLGISYLEESRRYHLDKLADARLVFRHRAGLDTRYQGVAVRTNRLGLRDEEIGQKKPGELRILALGDSVTFGWGVRRENTFAERLEKLLRRDRQAPVSVINSGVGGYNTEQEFYFAQRYLSQLAPDIVLLVYVINDMEINEPPFNPWQEVSLAGKNPLTAARLIAWHSWLYRVGAFALRINRPRADGPPDTGYAGFKRSMSALAQLQGLCDEAGIPLVVALYRLQDSEFSRGLNSELSRRARRLGFIYADMLVWLRAAPLASITNSTVDARHPNAAGHALIAQGLYGLLKSRGLP